MRRKKPTTQVKKITDSEVPEFLRLVKDDVAYLSSIDLKMPSRTDVRLSSSVLRRLLHEGLLSAAWKIAGFDTEPTIEATDLVAMIGELPRRYIHYAYAGGAETKGAQHSGYILLVVPKEEFVASDPHSTAEELSKKFKIGVRRHFSLTEFNASECVISGDAGISRVGIVRYVSNKLGGVHWDNERGGWTEPVGSRHRLLDEAHLIVGHLPAALYEVLSIAQAVVDSEDIQNLSARINKLVPEEPLEHSVIRFRAGRLGQYENVTFQQKEETQS